MGLVPLIELPGSGVTLALLRTSSLPGGVLVLGSRSVTLDGGTLPGIGICMMPRGGLS